MVRKRALSEEQAQALIEDYRAWDIHDPEDDTTIASLAAKYGVSPSTVARELRDRGEPLKPHKRPLSASSVPQGTVEIQLTARLLDAVLDANQATRAAEARARYLEGILRAHKIDFEPLKEL